MNPPENESTGGGANPEQFRFGDWIVNGWASVDNPWRLGRFVRLMRRTGKLNPGLWAELTDGLGLFWNINANPGEHRLTPLSCAPEPSSPGRANDFRQ